MSGPCEETFFGGGIKKVSYLQTVNRHVLFSHKDSSVTNGVHLVFCETIN